jgi:hypothetical protein
VDLFDGHDLHLLCFLEFREVRSEAIEDGVGKLGIKGTDDQWLEFTNTLSGF